MLNWDLFTHPQIDGFAASFPKEEKMKMAAEWKEYMEELFGFLFIPGKSKWKMMWF